MKIIISPAKKMRVDTDGLPFTDLPVFLSEAEKLKEWIRSLTLTEAKKLWACSDRIAAENYERFRDMDLKRNLTPAILSYDGIQYTYMAPVVFEDSQFTFVQENVRILSGFYGVLKPMDGVTPYRLEMCAKWNGLGTQAKTAVESYKDLYDFWGDRFYREVIDESRTVINLASKEYSKCIEKYLRPEDCFITCIFGELEAGKVVQKGVYAKMARGEMVRFMAEKEIKQPEQMKEFNWRGYRFDNERSSDREYVFIRSKAQN